MATAKQLRDAVDVAREAVEDAITNLAQQGEVFNAAVAALTTARNEGVVEADRLIDLYGVDAQKVIDDLQNESSTDARRAFWTLVKAEVQSRR